MIRGSLLTAGIFLLGTVPAWAGEGDFTAGGGTSLALLVILVLALFGLAWGLKRFGPLARVKKTLGLTVVGQLPLNQKASLALVRIGQTMLLVGVTAQTVTLVKDLGPTFSREPKVAHLPEPSSDWVSITMAYRTMVVRLPTLQAGTFYRLTHSGRVLSSSSSRMVYRLIWWQVYEAACATSRNSGGIPICRDSKEQRRVSHSRLCTVAGEF